MEKIELLSPAGNMESLYMAVHAGADAIYISGKKFGARAFANNFDENEIVEAINYCHLYGVKVYVTMNTLIFENEINEFIDYAKFLYINNVDAVIVQDIGMISYLRKYLPDLEIHSSTQTHNYNIETTKMFKEIGVKRVVLARELSIKEIQEHAKILDTEIFVHGALCMSYSGCCYMSLLRGNRSGNRGMCAGTCRLKYDVKGDNKYILSTKDLCNINQLDQIIESGVKSIKIEGRMKSKEYVYLVTKLYRKTIDNYYKTKKIVVDKELYNDIKRVFNREYTVGHKFLSKDIMNQKRPNNSGIKIGTVCAIDNKYITIKLEKTLINGDGIKFESTDTGLIITNMYVNNKKVSKALPNQIVKIKSEVNLNNLSSVVKTLDKELIDKLKKIEEKKIELSCKAEIDLNQIKITYSDGTNKVEILSKEVEHAKKISITEDDIKYRLKKLGNTPFIVNKFEINLGKNLFINIKVLNDLKKQAIEQIISLRQNYNRKIKTYEINDELNLKTQKNVQISASVVNEEQYRAVKQMNINNIYTTNIELNNKYKDTYLILPRIIEEKKYDSKKIVINDYNYLKANDIVANYYLNITNSKSALFAINKGVNKICVSPDLNIDRLKEIIEKNKNINFEVQVYGPIEVMITKNNFGNYPNFKSGIYKYKTIDNKTYISIINEPINKISQINEYKKIGIKSFRADFYDETPKMINKILSDIKKVI